MRYNHGLAEKEFKKNWEQQKEMYQKAGMTEEMIAQMFEYERQVFNSERRYLERYEDIQISESDSEEDYDARESKIREKNRNVLSVELYDNVMSDFWWLNEIEDANLYKKILALSCAERELLTLYAIEEHTIVEISRIKNVSHQTISKKISKIKKKLMDN